MKINLDIGSNNCKLVYSQTWGENSGSSFSGAKSLLSLPSRCSSFSGAKSLLSLPSRCQMRVEEVQVTYGESQTIWNNIDKRWIIIILQLRLKIGNGTWSYWTDVYGGNNANSTLSSFVVPEGEHIKTVLMRSGYRIDRLQFVTDRGSKSQEFGGTGGGVRTYDIPGRLVGVFGRKGVELFQLGFITARDSKYFITLKFDGDFIVLEEIDETKWIEWIVLKDNTTRKNFFWDVYDDTVGSGIVTLYDKSRNTSAKLTPEAWYLKNQSNKDFYLYLYGKYSDIRKLHKPRKPRKLRKLHKPRVVHKYQRQS